MSLTAPFAWSAIADQQYSVGTHIWEVECEFDGSTTQYMATSYYSRSGNVHQPYVLGVSDLDMGLTDDSNVGALSGCTIRLRRGVISGSAQTMDERYAVSTILGKPVRVYSQFSDNASARVCVAQFIVHTFRVLDALTIELDCINDERKLIDLPAFTLGDSAWATNYDVAPGYDGAQPQYHVVGTVRPSNSLSLKKWEVNRYPGGAACQAVRVIPESNADPNLRGGAHFNIGRYLGNTFQPDYALEYVDGWDAYARIVASSGTGLDVPSTVTVYDNTVDATVLQFLNPAVTQNGVLRAGEVRAMAVEMDGLYSTATANANQNTVAGAMNVNTAAVTLTVGGTTKLSLVRGNTGGEPPDAKAFVGVFLCYTVGSITGTPTLSVYQGTVSTDAQNSALVSSVPTAGNYRQALASSWDIEDRFYKWQVSGTNGHALSISDVFIEFVYRTTVKIFQRYVVGERITRSTKGRFTFVNRRYDYDTVDTAVWPDSNKLVVSYDGDSTAVRSGNYGMLNPTGVAYYVLFKFLGYAAGDIDTTSFDEVHSFYVTDTGNRFNTWRLGRQITDTNPSIDTLRELCSQAGMLLYRSGDGKWKLYCMNHVGGTVRTFGDTLTDLPAWDFRWSYDEGYHNAFTFNYRWDPIREKFGKSFRVDKDATVTSFLTASKAQCSAAFTAYGAEVEAPPVDLYWVQDSTVAENCAKVLINYLSVRRRHVTFRTKVSGFVIEPGDCIQTNHTNQTWSSASVTFQVRRVRLMPGTGESEITCYEINEAA